MNNGKVRIYELSKELNLDNRDILAVCDQLNISVKSHSSTISDAEAARIRSAAEKYTPSHSSLPNKPNVSAHSTNSQQPRKASSPPPVKKQQILEIRRNRPLVEPPKRPSEPVSAPAPANVAQPPVATGPVAPPPMATAPVATGPATGPAVPTAPLNAPLNAPPRAAHVEVEEPVEPTIEADSALVVDDQPAEPIAEPTPAEPPATLQEKPAVPAPPPVKSPPQRAVEQSQQVILSNRPVLRRASKGDVAQDGNAIASRSAGDGSGVAAPSRPSRQIIPASEKPALKPKPVIELRSKPTRPVAPGEGGEPGSRVAAPIGVGAGDELRRPSPPKPPKRGKDWEEEEEDQEIAAKSKVGVKAKRRTTVDDEDVDIDSIDIEDLEDLDEEEIDESAPVQVTLSLMRPPKPKGRPGQPKPIAVASPTKKRSGGERSFRRDRREQQVAKERPSEITLTNSLSVHDLAEMLGIPETDIIKTLFFKGIAANINQILDIPTATMVAEELEVTVETAEAEAEAKKVTEMLDASDLESLQRRPPVVTIMGHVDHGKTTLLDSIRKTKVAQGEAGGITQHIGAYHVDVEHDGKSQQVVFLDTPGHEAFTAMRARGARVTDIAVLVVAADDGVRPQTIEAISHAKAAGVPIVVAINKVDKEEAQPDRVKQELTEYGLVAEEWGGDTIMVPVSAMKGENLDTLLEMLLLVAEVEDLYANPDRPAKGTVIEANLDKSKGPVATLLIQNGTLRVGDVLVAGSVFGKVRAMVDDRGKRVSMSSPSFPVEVLGLSDVPAAGDEFEVYPDEKEARAIASTRSDQQRLSRLQQAMASRRVSLNTISAKVQEGELKELNLILKADVQGSVEAILGALQQLPQKEVQVRVLLAAPGEITETDVDLAAASEAVIIGFNTTFASGARQASDQAGVDVRDYNIIYKLLEDVQGAMEGLLEPELVEEPLGRVEVRAVFPVGKGSVAGCYIQSGKAIRNCKVRVLRGGNNIFEGNLDSLKRMREDVREVNAGYECGIGVDNFKDWVLGDIIETYQLASKRRTLSV
ncbi:MAG TPA: translation initiation factor IF-2 [Chroococcidiopsis sp.]